MRRNRSENSIATISCLFILIVSAISYQLGALQNAKEDKFTIKVRTDLVELFLTVKDGNRFVRGLTRDDFSVYDDGQLQQLVFFDAEDFPLSAALLLDTSGSMQQAIGTLRVGAIKFVESLRDEDEVMIIGFGGMVKELVPFTRDKAKLIGAIANIFVMATRRFTTR